MNKNKSIKGFKNSGLHYDYTKYSDSVLLCRMVLPAAPSRTSGGL